MPGGQGAQNGAAARRTTRRHKQQVKRRCRGPKCQAPVLVRMQWPGCIGGGEMDGEVPLQLAGKDWCRKNRGKAAVHNAEAVAVAVI